MEKDRESLDFLDLTVADLLAASRSISYLLLDEEERQVGRLFMEAVTLDSSLMFQPTCSYPTRKVGRVCPYHSKRSDCLPDATRNLIEEELGSAKSTLENPQPWIYSLGSDIFTLVPRDTKAIIEKFEFILSSVAYSDGLLYQDEHYEVSLNEETGGTSYGVATGDYLLGKFPRKIRKSKPRPKRSDSAD